MDDPWPISTCRWPRDRPHFIRSGAILDRGDGTTGTTFAIGNRRIGPGEPTFIVAEAGSNHNGSLQIARSLVESAAAAGADAVKFQTFVAERIVSETSMTASSLDGHMREGETVTDLFRRLELPREWHVELRDLALSHGLTFLSTPFDEASADLLERLNVPAFKVASYDLTHLPLLRHLAGKGKPTILSTGMGTLGEIEEAVGIFREKDVPVAILHCPLGYPPPLETINLAAIDTLRRAFDIPVGFSDHTAGWTMPVAAVARGASILEKHITMDRGLPGPDHHFALEPQDLNAMVRAVREVEKAAGDGLLRFHPHQQEFFRAGRRSLFAAAKISKGETITRDKILVIRPATGIAPKYLERVVGRVAQRDIDARHPITWDDI